MTVETRQQENQTNDLQSKIGSWNKNSGQLGM